MSKELRTTNIRAGSVICGFVDAEFDAKYLVMTRGGTSHPFLRGVGYKSGHYVFLSRQRKTWLWAALW